MCGKKSGLISFVFRAGLRIDLTTSQLIHAERVML